MKRKVRGVFGIAAIVAMSSMAVYGVPVCTTASGQKVCFGGGTITNPVQGCGVGCTVSCTAPAAYMVKCILGTVSATCATGTLNCQTSCFGTIECYGCYGRIVTVYYSAPAGASWGTGNCNPATAGGA